MSALSLALALALALSCTAEAPPEVAAAEALRVVSLHDTTTEYVALLGRSERLVGVTEPRFLSDGAAAKVAAVTRLPPGAASAEAILALGPDLVLGTDVVAERQPALGAELEALGVEALFVDPAGLDGLWATARELGARLNAGEAAEAWVRVSVEALPEPYVGEPVGVFLYDCCDPPFTAGGRAPASELLARMGAQNVFGDQDQDWLTVSWEAASAANPDLILVHDYPWEGQAGVEEKQARLRAQPLMARTGAVQRGRVSSLPLALTLEGPRTLELPAALAPAIAAARGEAR